MRTILLIFTGFTSALLAGAILLPSAEAREWEPDPASVPACDGHSDHELGCGLSACDGYATAAGWATEVQARFMLPAPPLGGPWLVEYVAFFISGAGSHRVLIRAVDAPLAPPGEIIDDSKEFTPVSAAWPPVDWTFVELRPEIDFPDHLQGNGGDLFTVGTQLLPEDALGLCFSGAEAHAWGYQDGTWQDDSGVGLAIRVGLSDLGLSDSQRSTWGRVKDLFK